MNYTVAEQAVGTANPELGIVLLNHVGSSCSEDTGRDARAMAEYFGLQVIAADRPGSGDFDCSPLLAGQLSHDYVTAFHGLGRILARETDRRGLDRVIITGRSAGALGALALTRTELLAASHLYSAEAVGWYVQDPDVGRRHYHEYNRAQRRWLAEDTAGRLVHPDKSEVRGMAAARRLAAMPALFRSDIYHHRNTWSQAIALDCAKYIAEKMPDVEVVIDFAQHSLGAPQALIDKLIETLPSKRTVADRPFNVRQLEGTVHASFDKRSFLHKQLEPLVAHARSVV